MEESKEDEILLNLEDENDQRNDNTTRSRDIPWFIEIRDVKEEKYKETRFVGNPKFQQNIQNSYYVEDKHTWVFIDDLCTYYTFNEQTGQAKSYTREQLYKKAQKHK